MLEVGLLQMGLRRWFSVLGGVCELMGPKVTFASVGAMEGLVSRV